MPRRSRTHSASRGTTNCSRSRRPSPSVSGTPSRATSQLGKAFAPADVRSTSALPKTRSAKILRRTVRATVLGEDPGDLSTLEDPGAIEAVRESA
jgi:acyl-CoA synthetase (AMP-forming)/AMP-acid ligase II